ncbi:hypothetical protein DFH28DRAFT_982781 [Melampsora americana]|nr:hypothetical protein DFH28DRAFT_982781 [Melampsora americana]
MQFGLKLVTLLVLLTLASTGLAAPVANEPTAGKSILTKRFTAWNLGGTIQQLGSAWMINGNLQVGRWGQEAVVWSNGNWMSLPQTLWPQGFAINALPDFNGFPVGGQPFFTRNGYQFFGNQASPFWINPLGHHGRILHPVDQLLFL